jgi:ubiquitin-conjugating enzyme E2 D/E
MASRRLRAETARFQSSDVPFGIIAGPKNNDMLEWEAQLTGPSESPYANGTFNVKLELSAEYPFKPPKVKFLTKIYHPNIDNEGNICITLLKYPNADQALDLTIASEMKEDYKKFAHSAKEWTKKYAI